MVLLGAGLVAWLATQQEKGVENEMVATAQAMSLATDHELGANFAALIALGNTDSLTRGDLKDFYDRVLLAQRQHPDWYSVILTDAKGQELLNSAYPLNGVLPSLAHQDIVERFLSDPAPLVSNLTPGQMVNHPVISLIVPVFLRDQLTYGLMAVVKPESFSQLLSDAAVQNDTVLSLFDGNGLILARSSEAANRVGLEAPPWLVEQSRHQSIGYRHGLNRSMVEVAAAYAVIHSAPWTIYVSRPIRAITLSTRRTIAIGAGLMVLILVTSILLSSLMARRIGRPVAALAAASTSLSKRIPIALPGDLQIKEIEDLWTNLALASTSLLKITGEREEALRAYAALQEKARLAAEEARDAKSRFLASASHDLRQPFQAMRLFHELLSSLLTEPRQILVASKLGNAMSSGEELLNALLDISLLDAGVMRVHLEEVKLGDLLSRVVVDCMAEAESRKLTLRSVPSSLVIRTDRVLLARMIRNLVLNALRYTEKGGAVVGCRRRPGLAVIQVADSGIGIPAAESRHIFEDFYQVSTPDRPPTKGLGLGLGTVARIAKLLGYKITLASEPGHGTIFSIEIPL